MKLDAARTDAFLRYPTTSIVLLHGPDSGLVAERGLTLARSVDGALNDPFRFTELPNPGADTLLAEATAASLTGGKRVVRVRDAHEALAKPLETLLKAPPEALIILEAGELTPKSKLRALGGEIAGSRRHRLLRHRPGAAAQVITARLRARGREIDQDAAAWAGRISPARKARLPRRWRCCVCTRARKSAGLEDVSAVLADGGDSSMGDAIDAALTGDPAATDRALALAYDEGVAPVGLLRVLLAELLRLRVAAGAMAEGASAQEAMAGMRPPVFFKRQASSEGAAALAVGRTRPGHRRRVGGGSGVQDHAYAGTCLLPSDHAGLGHARAHRCPAVRNFFNFAWKSGAVPRGTAPGSAIQQRQQRIQLVEIGVVQNHGPPLPLYLMFTRRPSRSDRLCASASMSASAPPLAAAARAPPGHGAFTSASVWRTDRPRFTTSLAPFSGSGWPSSALAWPMVSSPCAPWPAPVAAASACAACC